MSKVYDVSEFIEGDYICHYKLVEDPDSPLPVDKIWVLIDKQLIKK